jgi:hypothetical protein
MLCSPVEVHWCFRGSYSLHHETQKSKWSKKPTACFSQVSCFGWLFFKPEVEPVYSFKMFLTSAGIHGVTFQKITLHSRCCESCTSINQSYCNIFCDSLSIHSSRSIAQFYLYDWSQSRFCLWSDISSVNICYHSVQNLLSSYLPSENIKVEIFHHMWEVCAWHTDWFWIGRLDLLTPYTFSSGLQAIQCYRRSTPFTAHHYTCTKFLSHYYSYPGNGYITVSLSLQITHEVFLSSLIPFLPFLLNHLRLPSPEFDPFLDNN